MTNQRNTLARLFAACWSDPRTVLAESGMSVPDGMNVKVVENADDCVHIILPSPPAGNLELSDTELGDAAGGCGCHHFQARYSHPTMAYTRVA